MRNITGRLNPAVALRPFDCLLEQHQGQSEALLLVCTNLPGYIFQVLNHADNRVEAADVTGFQKIKQQLCSCPVDRFSLLLRQELVTRLLRILSPDC